MDATTTTLIVAIFAGLAGIGSGIGLEAFKRRRDRHGVAMAMAGIIEAELWTIERRGHVQHFRALLPRVEAGEKLRFYGFAPKEALRNQYADAYLDKVGILGGTFPADVIRFVQTMWGIRVDLARLVSDELGDDCLLIASIIRQDLGLVEEMQEFGHVLAKRLRLSARPWPHWFWQLRAGLRRPGEDA